MAEFELIDAIVAALADSASAPHVRLGPGDDAAVIATPTDAETVASIDTLLEGTHFPVDAPPREIGYRAMAVSLSDLAAMGAEPSYVLVALTLPHSDAAWLEALAAGMADASRVYAAPIVGGNLSRGSLSLSVSVHGTVAPGAALTRSGAQVGDGLFVTGALGASAAVVESGFEVVSIELLQRYYRPPERVTTARALSSRVSAAIDISDGLVADAGHLASMSGVQLAIARSQVPVFDGATIEQALFGSDDYELLLTSSQQLPGCHRIGSVVAGSGVTVGGQQVEGGYDHFR